MSTKTSQEQQAEAWRDICSVLDEVDPGWISRKGTGCECAINAIYGLAIKAKGYEVLDEMIRRERV